MPDISFPPAIPDGTTSLDSGNNPITKRPTTDYQVLITDDYIISDGGNTITLPLFANMTKPISIANEGITNDTIDGNGKTVPNSTSLTPTEVRIFAAGATELIEQ